MIRLPVAIVGLGLLLGAFARAETVEGPDLWVVAPAGARETAIEVRDGFPALLSEVEEWLGIETEGHVTIYLCEDLDEMRRMLGSNLTEHAIGASSAPGTIGVRLDRLQPIPGASLWDVLGHETVHHVLSQLPRPAPPRWFGEGLALRRMSGLTDELWAVLDAHAAQVFGGPEILPPLTFFGSEWNGGEDDPFRVYFAGLYGTEHFLDRHGERGLRRLISLLKQGRSFDSAFQEVVGLTVDEFDAEARQALRHRRRAHPTPPPAGFFGALVLLFLGALLARRWVRRAAAS